MFDLKLLALDSIAAKIDLSEVVQCTFVLMILSIHWICCASTLLCRPSFMNSISS